jgi:hypothetical protein
MLHRRVPVSLFTVLLAILALAASMLIAGCKESGTRLTVGGQEAADLAAEDETAAPAQGTATAAAGQAAGAAAGGGRGGRMAGGGIGGGMRGGGMRGGMRGGGMRGGGAAGGAAQTAAQTAAPAPDLPVRERPELTEVEVAEKVEEFASLFGPVSRIKEQYWDDKATDWLLFTYTGENRGARGRKIKLPLSMVEDAGDQSILEGYFPIYVVTGLRPSGNVISRQEVSVPKITIAEYKEQYAAKATAAREAAAEEAAAAGEADDTAAGTEAAPAAATTEAPAAGGRRMGGGMGGGRRGRMGQ